MTQRIVIAAEPRTPIPVSLVGVEYLITPPKSTIAIALAERVSAAGENPGALMSELRTWIELAFGKKQAPKVIARLDKADDDLDVTHVIELMTKLAEAASANPST